MQVEKLGDSSVNGAINSVSVYILGGTVEELQSGTSKGTEIEIDNEVYTVVLAEGTVEIDAIVGEDITITYVISINESDIQVSEGETKQLTVSIKTEPAGYENLFDLTKIVWSTSDPDIVQIDENGVITGVNAGEAIITANYNNVTDSAIVLVVSKTPYNYLYFLLIIVIVFILLFLTLFAIFACSVCINK